MTHIPRGKQVYDMNCYEIYALIVTWYTIHNSPFHNCLFTIQPSTRLSWLHTCLHSSSSGNQPPHVKITCRDNVLQLEETLTSTPMSKSTSWVWHWYLVNKLSTLAFNSCPWQICFVVCVDDAIFLDLFNDFMCNIFQEIYNTGLDLEDQGYQLDYLVVNVNELANFTYKSKNILLLMVL